MSRQINDSFNARAWEEYLAVQHACLPQLPAIERVSSRVIRIQAGNPGQYQLQGTSTYLVGTGPSRILIDTGEGIPVWADNLFDLLEAEGLEIAYVLLTHWHGDHTGGVPHLLTRYPHLRDSIYKNQPDRGQRPIDDRQTFSVEGATVRACFTPGHAMDHMCFVLEEESAMFTGDNVLGHGFTVFEDLGLFMASLEKMQAQTCIKGYPAHGAVIHDLRNKITLYLGRNLRRERQVVAALKASRATADRGKGSLTVEQLVRRLFGNVSEEVSATALRPFVDEVLRKLAEDRKVGFELPRVPGRAGPSKHWFVTAY